MSAGSYHFGILVSIRWQPRDIKIYAAIEFYLFVHSTSDSGKLSLTVFIIKNSSGIENVLNGSEWMILVEIIRIYDPPDEHVLAERVWF